MEVGAKMWSSYLCFAKLVTVEEKKTNCGAFCITRIKSTILVKHFVLPEKSQLYVYFVSPSTPPPPKKKKSAISKTFCVPRKKKKKINDTSKAFCVTWRKKNQYPYSHFNSGKLTLNNQAACSWNVFTWSVITILIKQKTVPTSMQSVLNSFYRFNCSIQ